MVFVSSDKDQAEFDEYYGSMPWSALPFESDKKDALDAKFKVQGIPTIIILDSDGNLLNKDGRAAISSDPTGEDFPWRQKTLSELLSSAKLIKEGGVEGSGADLMGKVFAFYFSAHWCPPCRGFTPKLAEWYTSNLKEKGLEIVFVSSDKTEDEFKEYFAQQPWPALDYSDRKLKENLSQLFGVSGIPSVVIIDADGSVISKDGCGAISSDPTGANFPWYPKPVFNLKAGPGTIQEVPTVIAFCDACDSEDSQKIEDAMTPLAAQFLADAKAAGEENAQVGFAIITSNEGIGPQLRKLMGLPSSPPKAPRLMFLDIPDKGAYFEGPEDGITEEVVANFVAEYRAKSLERKQAVLVNLPDAPQRMDTNARMDQSRKTCFLLPLTWCVGGVLLFWFPMIFFFAAANTLDTCEEDLGGFLQRYALILTIAPFALHFLMFLIAFSGQKLLFKFSEFLVHISGSVIGFIMNILGYMIYNNTTDEACYDGEADLDHHINPRKLLFAWIIMGFIGASCQAFGSVTRVKKQGSSEAKK